MSKRDSDELSMNDQKIKMPKKDDIAIDSELLGQQSSYNKRVGDQEVADAEAAAAAAVAAVTGEAHNAAQSHNLHMQHLAYQNAFRQQQQQQHHQQHHQQQSQQHTQQHAVHLQSGVAQDPSSPSSTGSNGGLNAEYSSQLQNSSSKAHHGTDEWHRQRRDNHKEVERRRRESINIGIKELAALIPTQDTNKAQILQRTVEYIKRLKENENNNIEKWTLEKLLTEQAVSELSASNEKLKAELERTYRELEQWKSLAGANKK